MYYNTKGGAVFDDNGEVNAEYTISFGYPDLGITGTYWLKAKAVYDEELTNAHLGLSDNEPIVEGGGG